METILKYQPVKCYQDVIDILSDQTGKDYRIYQEFGRDDDEIKTIATGMFILESHIFSLFTYFLVFIPLQLKLIKSIWLYFYWQKHQAHI